MSHSSRLVPPVTAAPSRPAKPGPCFRTDAEGRIALSRDWPKLFSEARRFDSLALQTRHTYVRLIHIGQVPTFAWTPEGAAASSATGSLRLNPARWTRASGRLAECLCCGTPGRIEIYNEHGLDFLQLCALPGCAAPAWADYLLDVFAQKHVADESAALVTQQPFPTAPADAVPAGDTPADELLPDFITALSDAELPFTAVLRTPEVVHVREIHPHRVLLHGPVLTVQASHTTLQIGLPAVRQLALGHSSAHGPQLHVLGINDALLLTLSAPPQAGDAPRWAAALRAAFPFSTHE